MEKYVLAYASIISLITVVLTIYDKAASKKFPRNRVPENILLLFAFLGGSIAEFFVMLIIRHKTKHTKFMIGLPVIMLLQAAIIFIVLKFFIM